MGEAIYKEVDLFGNENIKFVNKKDKGNNLTSYEEFVEKFKPKKTTDDCYTPQEVYAWNTYKTDEKHTTITTTKLAALFPELCN